MRRKEAGVTVKRILRSAIAELSLSVLILTVILTTVLLLDSGRGVLEKESFSVSAMQFGDVPERTVIARRKGLQDALLANGNGVSVSAQSDDLYTLLLNGLLSCESRIDVGSQEATATQVREAMTELMNSEPSLFYVGNSYQTGTRYGTDVVEYVVPVYKASGQELKNMKTEYEALVSKIMAEIRPSWSAFEKVLFVHDYLVENFEYDYSYSIYDSYSMLKNGKGVCQAYTLLCIELLGRLDIGVGAVPSTSMNHVWNCVELNGKWYHMDITWSDSSAPGNHDRFDEISYDNFLCSDSGITASGHYGWSSDLEFSDEYDDYFIKTVGRIKIAPLYDDWYIAVSGGTGKVSLCLADFDAGTYSQKEIIDATWYVWDEAGRYYTDSFAGLGSYHDAIVISTADTLYAYNPQKSLVKLGEYSFEHGYIYGMKNQGDLLALRVAKEPNDYAADVIENIDPSEIKFPLEISYKNKASGAIIDTYSSLVGWGKSFSQTSPNVSGLVAETLAVEGKMPLGGFSSDVLYKAYASLKINYVYENGEEAAPSYTDNFFEVGATYSIPSPRINSYRPSIAVVSGTMDAYGVTVTVTYTSTLYDLKIHYVYENGEKAAESFTASALVFGHEYSVVSPGITGYTPSIAEVSGSISEDTEITVVYTIIKCTVRVEYLYPDGSVAQTKEITVNWGEDYLIESPMIKGHTPETESVGGAAENTLVEHSVSYAANRYTLSIKYLYDDLTEAAPEYNETIEYGRSYLIDSPEIDSYTPSVFDVSGVMSDSDVEITVIYTLSRYTVAFWSQGELFYAVVLDYGSTVVLPDEIPHIEPTADKVYTFAYWDGFTEGMTVKGNEEFVAVFNEAPRKYSVVFKNYDGSVLYETPVEYGKNAQYVGDAPVREGVDGIKYTFVGWDEDTENITCDMVFTAMFSDGVTQYTVSFYDAHGNLLKSEKVYYGQSATPPEDPSGYADKTYEYFFSGWSGKYKRVTTDSTVNATYRKVYIEYEIVFKDHLGNVIFSEDLHYGDKLIIPDSPKRVSDERYDYVFEKWSPELPEAVTENAVYTAVFTAVPRYDYTAEEFIEAVEDIDACVTLSDRFAALSKAFKMSRSVYEGDDGVAEAITALEEKIRKYNEEISSINDNFVSENESSASFFSERMSVIKTVSLAVLEIKKRRGAEVSDE